MNCYQDEFDQTNGLRYLNHAAVAPWPRRAADAVSAFARENVAHGASDYPEWLKIEHRLRERLARLLNARAGSDLALVKNTSEALSFVAFGLDWREGDQVVIGNEEFPSNRVVWKPCARAASKWSRSVSPATIPRAPCSPPAARAPACCRSARCSTPAACALTWSASARDVAAAGCCSASTRSSSSAPCPSTYRPTIVPSPWPMGTSGCSAPKGLGVFYCHPEQRERLALHEYGWHMLEHALDYERRDWRPARSARRFECGSPNMLGAMALEASLGLLEEVGMERVGRDIAERVQWLQDGLSGIPGVRLHSPRNPSRRAGILTFSLDGQDNRTLFETLRQERVICAQRGGGIRFSPHFYTSSTVIDDTLAILRQVAGT